jgi:hypothetical protein
MAADGFGMSRALYVAALVCGMLGLGAPTGDAALPSVVTPVLVARVRAGLSGGPVVSGGGALWLQRSGHQVLIRRAQPGGASVELARVAVDRHPSRTRSAASQLVGSDQRLAVRVDRLGLRRRDRSFEQTLLAGPLGRPLTALVRTRDPGCRRGARERVPGALDLDGDKVASVEQITRCGDPIALKTQIVVYGSRRHVVASIPGGDARLIGPVRIAGPFVAYGRSDFDNYDPADPGAYANGETIFVVNWQTKRVLYKVDLDGIHLASADFDVRQDGTVVTDGSGSDPRLLRHGAPGVGIAWMSPASPTPHVLTTPIDDARTDASGTEVRVSSDVVAVARSGDKTTADTLTLMDLAGNTTPVPAFSTDPHSNAFDLRGNQLVWINQPGHRGPADINQATIP